MRDAVTTASVIVPILVLLAAEAKAHHGAAQETVVASQSSSTASEASAPELARVPGSELAGFIQLDPSYRDAGRAKADIVVVFRLAESPEKRLVRAWAPTYMPISFWFNDNTCYRLGLERSDDIFPHGKLAKIACDNPPTISLPPAPPPEGRPLRLVSASWGFRAWVDDRTRFTYIAAPGVSTFEPLFLARMEVSSIMGLIDPDGPGGAVTLVGKRNGQTIVAVVRVAW